MESTTAMEVSNDPKTKQVECDDPLQQEARARLREEFLRTLSSLTGSKATFNMHENTKLRGKFLAADIDILHFFVTDLETPLGTQPSALLRSNDIISIDISLKDKPA